MISTQAAEVPPKGLSRSASTSAMLAVGRREAAAAGRPVRTVAGGREEGALPSVQAVKGLHKSVQFATLPHTLWPVVVESSRPSCGAMTPSPPSATSDARPSRPTADDDDSTPAGPSLPSRGLDERVGGRHFHCPLCGVLCVADHSGEGVKMHLLGCRMAPRRKMGPSMINIEKAGEVAGADSDSYTVDGIRPLNAGAEDRTRDHGLRFHNEVATRSFPRVLSFVEQLDSPGVAHRSPRKKYRKLYDFPAADDACLDDYIDALCVNALENRGLDLTGAKYTIVGSGVPPVVFGIIRGIGGDLYGINYMEAEQWREVTHVLVGPMVHVGSLRNFCHTVRRLALADKLLWVDCRDLLAPAAEGSVGGWTITSVMSAVTCSKRTLGSAGKASKRVKGSPTPSPVTSPDTKPVSLPVTAPGPPTQKAVYKPLRLCAVTSKSFTPAPQVVLGHHSDAFAASNELSPGRLRQEGHGRGTGMYSTVDYSPESSPTYRGVAPSPEYDVPLIPGVTVTPGKHRERRRRRGAVRQGVVVDGTEVTPAPRRSTRLSRSAPPKDSLLSSG
ncbi:hypothetical protein FOZ62_029823 [Perkinsus olseni]|uniref:Uncharacterized protein n=1 Tax=Perkinsus olseni TaxID=32597 RepID=A0A7J6QP35_PEROL|nr:hypothetical protein FOZ62_029823 [Perkinsus olseni]